MAMTVMLNGQQKVLPELSTGATLADAIAALGLKADRVAVEWNGGIVARESWGSAKLADGDKLEVVHFVGGGEG